MIARLRWLYLLYYAGIGTFLSYFAPYLRGLGFFGELLPLLLLLLPLSPEQSNA